ncbi:HpcH/HpaI aldolase/citrate lyase family protein [Actinosynnema sp. NPDC059335]|uniref:HpcH/HpaI aldolase/citrate lyase family protein n=1 Tax=Actinosynnema sp. NPDC059335 TaxID=3346804 RepID=UPI00366D8B62
MIPRSYLYVPGDQPAKLAKAAGRGADALIVDLEDAVALRAKGAAREAAAAYLAGGRAWVRVNADALAEDVAAVADAPGLAGLVVPKAEPALLAEVDRLLGRRPVPVVALLETARGIRDVDAVASAPRVVRLGVGEADLAAELGLRPDDRRTEMWPLRSAIVVASAAAGLPAPIGPVETAVRDEARLRAGTELLLRQGFRARTVLTPAQLPVVNAVFSPSPEEVAAARRVVALLAEAGSGVAVDEHGRFIDAAVARSAREVLDRADACRPAG